MIPILSATTNLLGNGLGRLSDALTCIVTHEINGQYELVMTYPITGTAFEELANGCIIWADSDNFTQQQGFRIYRITRPLNGIVTVYARHICYDMSGYVCPPINKSSLTTTLAALASSCVPSGCPFTFTSPRSVATAYKTETPMSLWQMMGGIQGSLLDVYGGEWDFDNYTATLRTTLGSDRGVSIRYGKNMTELEQDASIEAQYGGIFPFWYNSESGTLVTLPENYITVTGGGSRVLCIDFSDEFEDAPTVTQLRNRATQYATANKVGDVQISWKVAFVPLMQSPEYKNIGALEAVQLGDTVHVYYEPMNLTATARAVQTEYNVLLNRFETVTLGRVKQNLAKIVTQQKRDIDHTVSVVKSTLEHAIGEATDFIVNGAGYMRFIYDTNNELVEIVSLDDPDIDQASSVWRWNNGGFGHSSTGYNGQYTTAITQNGAIVADFITAGTLNANVIRAGILQDANGDNSWNLTTGAFTITNGTVKIATAGDDTNSIRLRGDNVQVTIGTGGLAISKPVDTPPFGTVLQLGANIAGSNLVEGRINLHNNNNGYSAFLYPTFFYIENNPGGVSTKYADIGYDGSTMRVYLEDDPNESELKAAGLTVTNSTNNVALSSTTLTLTTSAKTTTFSAGLIQFTNSGTLAIYNGSSSKYGALIWPDGNGAGRLILGDGTSTNWRTELTNDGLVFRNSSNTVTASYNAKRADNVVTKSGSAVSVASATSGMTELTNITLTTGLWMISASLRFPSNSTGYRYALISTTSAGGTAINDWATVLASPAPGNTTRIGFVTYVNVTAASATYYLNARQNSGSTLSCNGYMAAIKVS